MTQTFPSVKQTSNLIVTDLFDDIKDLDDHPEIAAALGSMIVAWANVETGLAHVLAEISGMHINQTLMGYYRIPTFEARVKFIQSMIGESKTTVEKDRLASVIDHISKLSGTRNNWVHGIWSRSRADGSLCVFNLRAPEGIKRRKTVKANDINQHTETLKKWTKELAQLVPTTP